MTLLPLEMGLPVDIVPTDETVSLRAIVAA